jgi:hypothetical protein
MGCLGSKDEGEVNTQPLKKPKKKKPEPDTDDSFDDMSKWKTESNVHQIDDPDQF